MAVVGTADSPLEIFGGLVTDMAPSDLPPGVSFDCQDVKFVPGSVQTRPGLLSIFSPIGGTPAINYLKTYVPPSTLLRLLALDASGSLWKESSVGVLSLISSAVVPASFGKSTSLFTREYLAIGDGKYGIDIPRQFDDTNFDRVSQVGPGIAPTAGDEIGASFPIGATGVGPYPSPFTLTGTTEAGNTVTATISAGTLPTQLQVGDYVHIAGSSVSNYNGDFQITAIPSTTTFQYLIGSTGVGAGAGGTAQFSLFQVNTTSSTNLVAGQLVTTAGITVVGYNGNFTIRAVVSPTQILLAGGLAQDNLASSGNGTITVAGNITAGVHKISVVFVTRQGFITCPAPAGQWTASGSKRVIVSNIPTGPSNVVARILLFTLTGQSFFFYSSGISGVFSSNFIIQDNTTTTVTVDFTDSGLSATTSADFLFRLVELGECSGVIDYHSRLFWWGERNKVKADGGGGGFINLTFDGGFTGISPGYPQGWAVDPTNGGGGQSAAGLGNPVIWGDAYQIIGNGAGAIRGLITQTAYQDINGAPIILPNTAYSVRARIRTVALPLTQGVIHVHLSSVSQSIDAGLDVTFAQATTTYKEFTAPLTTGISTPPSDLLLRVYVDGTPTNGGAFIIDCIEVYPTNQPFNTSLVRGCLAEDPESYDGITGFLSVSENDGFAVRSAFVIRENLYFVKEHSTWVTQDDGTNEPSGWNITEVSRKIGTPSVNGVAVAQDWAVIAHRTGLYFFSGGEPRKISQEIQPTWDTINWAAGQTIWTQIDQQNRRVYVGVPLNGATKPNAILMMDYRGIDPPDEIPTATPIHTSYSGKLLVLEKSRKWSIWNIIANSGALVERFDGTQAMFLGNGAGTGKIYQLSDTTFTDDGVSIPGPGGYYNTYFHFSHDLEQVFQLGSHNKLYTYMRLFMEGNATLALSAILPGNAPVVPITFISLANPALRDLEFPINVTASRAAFKVSGSNTGDWWRLARFIVNAVKHPSAPTRGWN